MLSSQNNFSIINNWFNNHISLGGSVHIVHDTVSLIGSPEPYLTDIYDRFSKLTFEDVEHFMGSRILDNSMPNRALIEDATKLYYLGEQIKQDKLIFKPQLLHEPWADRYRVHPGSGRIAAMWKCDPIKPIESIYIHFNEDIFTIPQNSTEVRSSQAFLDAITYKATTSIDCTVETALKRTERDTEWDPTIVSTVNWEFIRYSEGKYFLEYKQAWRDYALDLWLLLNR